MPDPDSMRVVLTGFALGMPRMLTALAMLPFFMRSSSTALLRAAVAAAFVLPALPPMIAQVLAAPVEGGWLPFLMLKEGMIGLILGFAIAIPFWTVEALGFVIDNQRGATISGTINPLTGDEASSLVILLSQSYVVLFLALGGLTATVGIIYRSYSVWPVTALLPRFDPAFVAHMLGLLDSLVRTAIVLAAPVMIAMLLAELALALVSLFAPQMQVFFLAMPIKSGIALFILLVYFSTLLSYLESMVAGAGDILQALMPVMR